MSSPASQGSHAKLVTDLHSPLTRHEALVESDRCYFCHDAPCITACPTDIDIPLFIRQIKAGNPKGAAKTIFSENILGGMCARVCPTETLCEQACVRQAAEDKPVLIGLLQRFATDIMMATGEQPVRRANLADAKRIAVVGAGPAGLACAHRLALLGHHVALFEARGKPGGLNEYGIAAYKTVDNFAQREVDYILSVGGISVEYNQALGANFTLDSLKADYDAVFLGIGLGAVNELSIEGEALDGVEDAVEFIANLRQAEKLEDLSVGSRVVVIGGGMTAIDAAVQSRYLGADEVSVVYRRGFAQMNASEFECKLAQTNGVMLRTGLQPTSIIGSSGKVTGVAFETTETRDGQLVGTGNQRIIDCDHVLKAVGQAFQPFEGSVPLALDGHRLQVDKARRTSDPLVWAGGDCVSDGEDLTVQAVQDGKLAAESMHRVLTGA